MQFVKLTKKDIEKGNLILVNQDKPIKTYNYQQITYINETTDQKMDRNAARLLNQIFDQLHCHQDIIFVSGFRSFQEQEDIYQSSLRKNGKSYTQKYVAFPHCSEHETGLAIDLALNKEKIDFICPDFPYSGICEQWRNLANDYGFIERYTEEKKTITHIAQEPWHFRYVGFPHSVIMKEKNLCLEEYHEFIKNYSIHRPYVYGFDQNVIEIFYVKLSTEQVTLCLKDNVAYQVSGNNSDGVIVTTWRSIL